MAGVIRCGIKTVVHGATKSGVFGGGVIPVNSSTAVAVCFPVRKVGGVAACVSPPSTRKPRGITKPRPITEALQEIVGAPEISRTQALKLIWAHIKAHNLQDPNDKKVIVCDEKLKKIFGGKERVGFLEISGLITPHLL